jgi:putative transposase
LNKYAASNAQVAVQAAGLILSINRRGNCCDKAAMESFWGTLKPGLVYRRIFANQKQAKAELFNLKLFLCVF